MCSLQTIWGKSTFLPKLQKIVVYAGKWGISNLKRDEVANYTLRIADFFFHNLHIQKSVVNVWEFTRMNMRLKTTHVGKTCIYLYKLHIQKKV